MTTRLSVDRIRCDGHGVCAELYPEGIALDDWGFPIVTAPEVPGHLLPAARRAVSSCPVMALRLARPRPARHPRRQEITGVSQREVTLL
jgi:ferredoxin